MPNDVLTGAIDAVASGRDLTAEEAQQVLAEIMAGSVGEAQTAAFLIALRTKGETVEELTGLARTMRPLAVPVEAAGDDLLDTAGTGGGVLTFNVSTTAAFVAAGAGCRVAKHGNRSATSLCGSADLLEALGARIDLDAAAVGAVRRGGRLRLHVRARPPPGDEARRPRAQGSGRADDLQLPRAADQPGGREPPADRRLRPRLPGRDRGRAGRSWARRARRSCRARTAWTRSACRARRACSR